MNIKYPIQIDSRGRTAESDEDRHIREMIEQILFTSQGERVNRPDFGCGLMQLVFAPNSSELAATTQFLVQGALQQWMGHLIQVQNVDTRSDDNKLYISVQYMVMRNQRRGAEEFELEL